MPVTLVKLRIPFEGNSDKSVVCYPHVVELIAWKVLFIPIVWSHSCIIYSIVTFLFLKINWLNGKMDMLSWTLISEEGI